MLSSRTARQQRHILKEKPERSNLKLAEALSSSPCAFRIVPRPVLTSLIIINP